MLLRSETLTTAGNQVFLVLWRSCAFERLIGILLGLFDFCFVLCDLMPPESAPWDRKDFVRERKYERPESVARWRDPPFVPPYHGPSREFVRWGSADFRKPPGHGKQGGWHQFGGDSGHGYGPSRSVGKMVEQESCRPFYSRQDGKYSRSSIRDDRGSGSYNQRDWKGHGWESRNGSPNTAGRLHDLNSRKRSAADMLSYPFCTPDIASTCGQFRPKDQNDYKASGSRGLGTGLRCEKENSAGLTDLKPHKSSHSGGMSSRGLGVSHSSSSKSLEDLDSGDGKAEVQQNDTVPLHSDPAACVTSIAPSDDRNSNKKPRLGWGEGLEKFEKKIVEDPDTSVIDDGSMPSVSNQEPNDSVTSNLDEKSPRFLALPKCASPITHSSIACSSSPDMPVACSSSHGMPVACSSSPDMPVACSSSPDMPVAGSSSLGMLVACSSSPGMPVACSSSPDMPVACSSSPGMLVACSSSPGAEDKSFGKAAQINEDTNEPCDSSSAMSQNHREEFASNLEKLDLSSISNLASSITELIQPEDHSPVGSSLVRSTDGNKLLLWKADALKALESTEFEIDSLENELKSLQSNSVERCHDPPISSPLMLEGDMKSCRQEAISDLITLPSPLQIDQHEDAVLDANPFCTGVVEGGCLEDKNEDVDSPGSATSKFTEPSSVGKVVSPSDNVKHAESYRDSGTFQHEEINICEAPGCSNAVSKNSACKDVNLLTGASDDAQNSSLDWQWIRENISHDVILSANKELAKRACEALNQNLPNKQIDGEISGCNSNVAYCQSDSFVREKFAVRKRDLRLKERILALKYRAFHHLWKEDIRVPSVRKYGVKSQKKVEVALRAKHGVYSKHRSRSSSSGNLSLIPTMEFINFAGKLLSESQVKCHRNTLKMPALILDEKDKKHSRFLSRNGLVEDPCAAEEERYLINPWTSEEKDIFMDKLATFGKDFSKIASFLDHKTTADCVEFYYKNHKSDCFEKPKKNLGLIKLSKSAASTYLVTSGKNRSRERNAASIDNFGAVSVISPHEESRTGNPQTATGSVSLGACTESKNSRFEDGITEKSSCIDKETAAVDALAVICGSLSSEAMSSCLTSSVDQDTSEWNCQKVDSVMKHNSASEVTQNVDDDTCSDESCAELDPADWTDEEKSIFVQAFSCYGKDFSKISRRVKTRSPDQCKVFFSKVRKCLGLDLINPGAENMGTSIGGDGNSDGSDMEDACVLESPVVDDKLSPEVVNLPPSVSINEEGSDPSVAMKLQTDLSTSEDNNEMKILDRSNSEALESVVSDVSCLEDASQTKCSSRGNVDLAQLSEPPQKCFVLTGFVLTGKETGKDQVTEQCAYGEVLDGDPANLTSEPKQSLARFSNEAFKDDSKVQDVFPAMNKTENRDGGKCCSGLNFAPLAPLALHPVPMELDSTGTFPRQISFAAPNVSKIQDSDSFLCDKLSILDTMSSTNQSLPKPDRNISGRYFPKDCFLKKCNSSKSQSSIPVPPFLPPKDDPRAHSSAHPQSVSDTEKPCRNGNVKLFGQILKSSEDDNSSNIPKQCVKPSNPKPGNQRHLLGSSPASNYERLNYLGLENVPTSFGFWDGNRIRTVSSLTDPSVFLARYPAAFSNYPAATSKPGQDVLPSMNIRSSGVLDYQLYGSKMQQPRLGISPLHHQHNGFDAVPSLQPDGRGMTGMNVEGRHFGSVQDPVAALRLARTELYGVQNRSISSFIREEKSWLGKGDIGR